MRRSINGCDRPCPVDPQLIIASIPVIVPNAVRTCLDHLHVLLICRGTVQQTKIPDKNSLELGRVTATAIFWLA